jgi:hypothetical protein
MPAKFYGTVTLRRATAAIKQPQFSRLCTSEKSSRGKTIPTSPHRTRALSHQKSETTAPISSIFYQKATSDVLIYDLISFFRGFSAGFLPSFTTLATCHPAKSESRS